MEEEARLSELLETIAERLRDAIADMEAAVRCIQAYKTDHKQAETCILEYLKVGTATAELKK